jgi:hypothetical protein
MPSTFASWCSCNILDEAGLAKTYTLFPTTSVWIIPTPNT